MNFSLSFDPGAVLVAGGSGGIGEVIARRFAEAGLPVVITCHSNEQKAASIQSEIEAAGGRCTYHRLDLARPEQVDQLFAAVIAQLCSRQAGYITGQSIAVDGGLQL